MKTIYVLLAFLFSILSFAQRQTQYAIVDKQMSEIPLRFTYSTDAIAHYINARFQTEDEKIRAVFYWTASNISYDLDKLSDLNNKETSENNSEKTLNSKKGVCSDYTKIFKEIANKVGVKTEIISGYTKQNGVVVAISHAWCASKIDNLWYIFDPTWGSGHVNNGKFVTSFDDHYFKVNPNKIITSHMPYDYMWQFLNYPISNQEFYNGRTASANSKKRFDFEAEISNYNTYRE
jgi:transglutaminase/protease-like cytokinesis protein 3